MPMRLSHFVLPLFLLASQACQPPQPDETEQKLVTEDVTPSDITPSTVVTNERRVVMEGNVKKTYREDGQLSSEVPYRGGIRHGLGKKYYRDGTLHQTIEYVEGKKHGLATTYYQNGKLAVESEYYNNRLHGIRKRYHTAGFVMAEIPYERGNLAIGTKEYLASNMINEHLPEITFHRKSDDMVTASVVGYFRSAEWYMDQPLLQGKSLTHRHRPHKGRKKGRFFDFNISNRSTPISVVVKVVTWQGNPMLINTTFTP